MQLLPRQVRIIAPEAAMNDNAVALRPSAPRHDVPLFAELGREACEVILSRNSVGRIAFTLHDRVSIVPIHYVYSSGWIYGRTAAAGKLREILRNRRIAFEVDEHPQLFEWRSVVVRGPLYLIGGGNSASTRRVYAKAVALIRKLVPAALTDADPVPFRDQLFRIHAAEISGRASGPTGGKGLPRSDWSAPESGDPDADAALCRSVEATLAGMTLSSRSQVHVDAFDGVVVLTGLTEDANERAGVETAVLGVPGVRALVQELETIFPSHQQPTPAEIAREAIRKLDESPRITDAGIRIVEEHGWLRLDGVANSRGTRDEVVRRLRSVKGSRGVIDKLRILGPATTRLVDD
jgi:nitroimidazol reductase NimA-like FMN-containing flavoprotein (pyridoxamine 5'-phosphate oxidase superfamily)/osmotically-inducible protein OsmY